MRRSWIPLIGLLYLVAVGSGIWGYAVSHYEVFPHDQLTPLYDELREFVRSREAQGGGLLLRATMHRQERVRDADIAFSDRTGFHRVEPDFVDPGYLLLSRFSTEHDQVVTELVRLADFSVLHRWVPPIEEILARSSRDKHTRSVPGFRAQHPLLLEGGSLVFGAGEGPLVRVDRESEVEWVIDRHFHHSIERDADGNLLVPIVLDPSSRDLPVEYRDDGYAVVTPDGRILAERSVLEILLAGGYEALAFGIGEFESDRTHLNDVEPIRVDDGEARSGDLLLSVRNLSTVLLYRPSADQVVWLETGPWINQHDVNPLGDGEYSVFGNDVYRYGGDYLPYRGFSDVYVQVQGGEAVRRPYTEAMRGTGALTQTGGRARILSNGDIFVELSDAGQLFRLDGTGVVWVYVNGVSEDTVGQVHWARYLEADEIDLSWLPTQTDN